MTSVSIIYGGYFYASGEAASLYGAIDSSANSASYQDVAIDLRLADGVTGQLSKLTLHVSTNTQSTDTTVTLFVNGVDGALTVTVPAGQTGWFASTTATVDFVSGDLLAYHMERGDSGDIVIDSITSLLTKTGEGTATWLIGCAVFSDIGLTDGVLGEGIFTAPRRAVGVDSAPNYGPDDQYQYYYNVRTAGTAKFLQCYVTANDRDVDVIYKVYKNGIATDLSITIPADQSGWYVNETDAVSFAVGDKLSYAIISESAATRGSVSLASIHLMMESDSEGQDIVAGGNGAVTLYDGVGNTAVLGVPGIGFIDVQSFDPDFPETSKYAIKFPVAGTLSKLSFTYTNFGTYEGFTDQPFYCRPMISGVGGTQLIEVAAPVSPDQNGVETDATGSDSVVVGDEYYVEFGLSDLESATSEWGSEADIWSISASFTPASQGDEFGCTKTCDGSETYYSLVNKTMTMLGEDPDAPVYWSSAEIGWYVNEAYIEFCRESKALELIETITLTDGEGTMSANVGQVFRVAFDNRKIFNVTKSELDYGAVDWEALTGFVSNYVTGWQNNRTIRVYQKPTGGEGYSLEIWAVKVPDELSGCDEPELPCWSHLGLAFRAASKALRKYGEQRNDPLADAYDMIAMEYGSLLKAYVSTRIPEQVMVVGSRVPLRGIRKPQPWDTPVEG